MNMCVPRAGGLRPGLGIEGFFAAGGEYAQVVQLPLPQTLSRSINKMLLSSLLPFAGLLKLLSSRTTFTLFFKCLSGHTTKSSKLYRPFPNVFFSCRCLFLLDSEYVLCICQFAWPILMASEARRGVSR